jgi:hypothetical protein
MILVERHIVAKGKQQFTAVDELCFLSKNLYTATPYFSRQEYFSSGRIIRYQELERHFKVSNQTDYRALSNNRPYGWWIRTSKPAWDFLKGEKRPRPLFRPVQSFLNINTKPGEITQRA